MRRAALWVLIAASVLLVVAGIWLLSRSGPPAAVNTPTPIVATSSSEAPRISVQELNAQLQAEHPPLVWEFRSASSYAEAHVPGSRLLTLDEIEAAAQGLDRAQPIVTLCA